MEIKFTSLNKIKFKIIFCVLVVFFILTSCSDKCKSNQELLDKAIPINLTSSDKNSLAFYHINKMTFMVNDTSVLVYNLTSKNFTYNPCPEQNEGSCFNYSKKAEQNAFSYSSSSQIIPNITSYMKVNESPPPTGILFDINFSDYTPDPNAPYKTYRGVGGPNGTIFNLSSYSKIDSLKTAFDSIYFNISLQTD